LIPSLVNSVRSKHKLSLYAHYYCLFACMKTIKSKQNAIKLENVWSLTKILIYCRLER